MKKYEINKYTYKTEWSEDDQTHIARCLEFPSLTADGSSPEKALKEIKTVVTESIKWMIEDGESIPEPLGLKKFTGKYPLRMSQDLHRKVAMEAAEKGMSLNQFLISKISS